MLADFSVNPSPATQVPPRGAASREAAMGCWHWGGRLQREERRRVRKKYAAGFRSFAPRQNLTPALMFRLSWRHRMGERSCAPA
eukprot:4185890-Prymnesium_polylepis.2